MEGLQQCSNTGRGRTFESCRAHGLTKRFSETRIAKTDAFVLRTLPPPAAEKPASRAQREREAKAYWDSLTPAQEAWALRKMRFAEFGTPERALGPRPA
jgi:hypothetical protein